MPARTSGKRQASAAAAAADRVFHALGDRNRRSMLHRMGKTGPLAASQLAEPLGISLAAVVQHLNVLEEAGLITSEKQGRVRTCRVRPAGFTPAEQWFRTLRDQWEARLDRLGELLADGED